MEKEKNIILMEILNMKVILLMMIMKATDNIFGKMVNIIQANLKMDLNMEKEKNIIQMEILNMMVIILMMNMKEMEKKFMKITNIISDSLKTI